MIQSPEIVRELFLSWLAKEVSSEQVPKLHAVVNDICANIEDIFHQKDFFVKSFFEITDTGVLNSLSTAIEDMTDDLGCISRMISVLSLYNDFLEETMGQINNRVLGHQSTQQIDEERDVDEENSVDTAESDELDYIPKIFPSPAPPLVQKAERYLLGRDLIGVTYNELQTVLHYTMVGTKEVVSQSPHIVEMNRCLYHDEAFVDFEEGANAIEDILDKLMKKNNGIATATQLWEYACSEMSMFLNDNDITKQQAVYDLARYLFEKLKYHGKRYFFHSNIYISLPEISADSSNDIMQKYARERGTSVTFKEMESYLKGLGLNSGNLRGVMRIDKEPIFLIYQENEYLLAELIHMDDAFFSQIQRALKRLFADVGDHIIIRNISNSWYNLLPVLPALLEWTPMLLQQLLHYYSKELGARTIIAMDSQSSNTLHAMLVDNDSWIQDFRDAVAVYLHDEMPERRSFEAEELRKLLVGAGMISGNQLIWNMHKALGGDPRFLWDSDCNKVNVRL